MGKLNVLRRISQVTFFLLIVYIGMVGIQNLGIALEASMAEEADIAITTSPTGYYEILDTYGPVKTCRYVSGDARLFKGCSLHYFSKTLTTLASSNFAFVLPHLVLFFALAFIGGRLFCGWMCPMGFFGEVMSYGRKRLGIRHVKIPEKVNRRMAEIRYAIVSLILLISLAITLPLLGLIAYQKDLYIMGCQICPARIILPFLGSMKPVIYSFNTPIVAFISSVGVVFLLLYLSGVVFRRPWCRICPSGAMLSVFNSGSLLSKEKDVQKCTRCGVCSRLCLMDNKNVYLEKESKNISTANCIKCFKCVENCPEKGALKIKFLGKTLYESGSKMKGRHRAK
jgi:polyferredoxin